MKIIEPGHQYMPVLDELEFIEQIGRTCYKSENRITEGSAKAFVENLIKREHWAMLEHGTIYMLIRTPLAERIWAEAEKAGFDMRFVVMTPAYEEHNLVSGNLRAFENWFNAYECAESEGSTDMELQLPTVRYLLESVMAAYQTIYGDRHKIKAQAHIPIEFFDKLDIRAFGLPSSVLKAHLRHTVKFTCDRGVSHELVRHRPCSFAQESTRYANYLKEKFGSEITVIKPFFFEEGSHGYDIWKGSCEHTERAYMLLLEQGYAPQEARSVLPNSLKTELIMTATEEEWQHILNLRLHGTTGAPHPQMVELMKPWAEELAIITDGRVS